MGSDKMAKPPKKYSNLTLKEKNYIKKKLGITKIEDVDTTMLRRLKEELKKLQDSRVQSLITYKLWDIIMCVIISSFACNDDWEEIYELVSDHYNWFKSFLQMTGGISKASTYERVMGLVDAQELNKILYDFFKSITLELNPNIETINFDGRVNNGSKRKIGISETETSPLNCLNAYSNKYGYCIGTVPIEEKSNEIPAIEKLVLGMNLTGVIVTWC